MKILFKAGHRHDLAVDWIVRNADDSPNIMLCWMCLYSYRGGKSEQPPNTFRAAYLRNQIRKATCLINVSPENRWSRYETVFLGIVTGPWRGRQGLGTILWYLWTALHVLYNQVQSGRKIIQDSHFNTGGDILQIFPIPTCLRNICKRNGHYGQRYYMHWFLNVPKS